MAMAYVERIGQRVFKLKPAKDGEEAVLNYASLNFVRAAITQPNKPTPFEGLASVCNDVSFLFFI